MKIALGSRLQEGAFGGGNQFARTLSATLKKQGYEVTHDLQSDNINLILVTEPRPWLQISAFGMPAALAYQQRRPSTKLILRINECDERKDTRPQLLNHYLIRCAQAADQVIFISQWLKDLFLAKEPGLAPTASVIRNGADAEIFHPRGNEPWNGSQPLKIVTHHWSAHPNKGWDVYQCLDKLAADRTAGHLEFTYIGNKPGPLPASDCLPPLSGKVLAAELRRHHIYVTGSKNEPAGMHHIEGALCGLPVLYRRSGALPEYNSGFGVSFAGPDDLESALQIMKSRYRDLHQKMNQYPYTAEAMCRAYERLFRQILVLPAHRPATLKERLLLAAHASALRRTPYLLQP